MFSSFSKTILIMETWLKAFLEDINKVIPQQGSQTRGLRAACGRDDILCGPRRILDFHINNNYYLLSLSGPHAFISIHSQWYYFLVLTLQLFFLLLFAIFVLHLRGSELYRYTLDGKSALAWELPFSRFMGHLSST